MKKTMDDMSPAEIAAGLAMAKALIDHPDKWVQHAFEVVDGGNRRICAHRAMERAAESQRQFSAMMVAFAGDRVPDDDTLPFWTQQRVCDINNKSTHAGLMRHFDRAIDKQLSGG